MYLHLSKPDDNPNWKILCPHVSYVSYVVPGPCGGGVGNVSGMARLVVERLDPKQYDTP